MSPWPWTGWYVEPEIPIGLVAVSLAYAAGLGPLRPLEARGEPVATRALLRFGLGMLTLFLALTGPLADLAGTFLISAHMVQHLLLTLIAPPLLLAAMPDWLLRPLLRPPAVAVVARAVTRPRTALAVFGVVLVVWHLPALVQPRAPPAPRRDARDVHRRRARGLVAAHEPSARVAAARSRPAAPVRAGSRHSDGRRRGPRDAHGYGRDETTFPQQYQASEAEHAGHRYPSGAPGTRPTLDLAVLSGVFRSSSSGLEPAEHLARAMHHIRRQETPMRNWISALSLPIVTLLPAAALAQDRPWETGWGMHPGWMWGVGGMVMMLMMLGFWALVIAAVVVGLRWLVNQGRREHPDRALDILRERYARGEIDREEFEARRRDLDSRAA